MREEQIEGERKRLGRQMIKLFVSDLWQVAEKRQRNNRSFCLCLVSYIVLCTISTHEVVCSVFNLSITPCKCVSMWGRADICTYASHFDFMTPLFPISVVSGWFIQWQTQSLWTGLACNDLSFHWKRLERKVGGEGRRENEDTQWGNNQGGVWEGSTFFHLH